MTWKSSHVTAAPIKISEVPPNDLPLSEIVNGASANPRLFLYELFSELVLMDVGQAGIEHNCYCTRVGVEYRGVNQNSCHSGTSYEVMHSC
jgi:hypothetical protein